VYLAPDKAEQVTGATPQSYAFLSEQALQAKAAFLLREVNADETGAFQVELSQDCYRGQLLEFHLCVKRGQSLGCGPAEQGGEFYLCRLKPDWTRCEERWEAQWNCSLPRFSWCRVLGLCHAQTLCGRVVDCHTNQVLSGVRVTAFGLDWNQDQALGQAVTDANGRFLIRTKHGGFRRAQAVTGSRPDSYDVYFRVQSQASAFPLYVDSIRWGERPLSEETLHCLQVSIHVETDLARLREEGRVASFLALTGSQSVLGLRPNPKRT
jgi:hypothetical protein